MIPCSPMGNPICGDNLDRQRMLQIFLLALAVRLLVVWEMSAAPHFLLPLTDAERYHTLALDLAEGGPLRAEFFFQSSLYPAFLAFWYWLLGPNILFVKLLQAVVGACTCLFTYILGRQWLSGRVSFLAGVIVALYGPLIFYETEIMSDGLSAFWAPVLVLAFQALRSGYSPVGAALAGVAGALATLHRATYFPLFLVGCFWFFLAGRSDGKPWGEILRLLGISALGFGMTVSPMMVANYRTSGRVSFLPWEGASQMFMGNNPQAEMTLGLRAYDWHKLYAIPRAEGVNGPHERERFFRERFFYFVWGQPRAFLAGLAGKFLQTISSRELPQSEDPYYFRKFSLILSVLFWKMGGWGFPFGLLLPLSFLGMWWARKQLPWLPAGMIISSGAVLILVHVAGRFRLPMVPLLALMAAIAVKELVLTWRGRQRAWLGATAAGMVVWMTITAVPGPFLLEKVRFDVEYEYFLGASAMSTAKRLASGNLAGVSGSQHSNRPWIQLAQSSFDRAIHLDDAFYPAFAGRGQLNLEFFGDRAKARVDFDRAISLEPMMAPAWGNRAVLCFAEGDFSGALADAEQAVALEPNDPRGFNTRGLIWTDGFARHDKALADFQKALDLDPFLADAYINRGKVFLATGNPDAAIPELSRAISLRPDSFIAFGNRGNAWFAKGDRKRAIEDYDRALAIHPQYLTARENREKVLAETASQETNLDTIQR